MDDEKIKELFTLYVGEAGVATEYVQVIEAAKEEVTLQLLPDASLADSRLNYLVAALAFLRYIQVTAARDRTASTIAGGIAQNADAKQKLAFAWGLLDGYRVLCSSLLADSSFLFLSA